MTDKNKTKQENIKQECNICLQLITKNFATLNCDCKVNYHKECIDNWLQENPSCPNCRKKVIIDATKKDKYSNLHYYGRNNLIYVFYHEDINKHLDISGLACTSFTAGLCIGTLCCTIS